MGDAFCLQRPTERNDVLRVGVVGVTLTGNLGGTSMLNALLDQLDDDIEKVFLFSVYPKKDQAENTLAKLQIVGTAPGHLILLYLPLVCLLWPMAHFAFGRKLLSLVPYFRYILESDVIADMSGIAFVDGRGMAVLVYNVAVCLPALLLGRKVVKLSQAFGPLNSPVNRWCARAILRRCKAVVTRGDYSASFVENLPMQQHVTLPDLAFSMSVSEGDIRRAHQLVRHVRSDKPFVLICPSQVLNEVGDTLNRNYITEFATIIDMLVVAGFDVALVPHSVVDKGERNNDEAVCKAIASEVTKVDDLDVLGVGESPRVLRAVIGSADGFIACRFHSMISALCCEIPTMVVGWSHKYREVMKMFGQEARCLRYEQSSVQVMYDEFINLMQNRESARHSIQESLSKVVERSKENFRLLKDVAIDKSNG